MESMSLIHNGGTPIIHVDYTENCDWLYFPILKISKCWLQNNSLNAKKGS